MRVVHVINSLAYGGAEKQLSLIAGKLSSDGIHQTVIPMVRRDDSFRLSVDRCIEPSRFAPLSILRAFFLAFCASAFRKDSVLVCWMYHSWIVGLLIRLLTFGRVKLFLYCRHGDPDCLTNRTRTIARLSLRLASWLSVPVVFNSTTARALHSKFAPNGRYWCVPNAVVIPGAWARHDQNVLAFLGRCHPDKGADLLPGLVAKLLSSLPTWRAVLAGPGIEGLAPTVKRALLDAGLDVGRVRLEGAVSDTDVFFGEASVLLIPSRVESFPNVLVEGMAHGVVPACMNVGDVSLIVDGIVPVASDDSQLLRMALAHCKRPASERVDLGMLLRERVISEFGLDRICAAHLSIWKEVA